jgi:glycosyltransferase involved in cell wall biosynthesis
VNIHALAREDKPITPRTVRILMTYHGLMDPDSGACGSMVQIGSQMEKLGVKVEYWTYSDMRMGGPTVSRHLRFPFSVARRSVQEPLPDLIDACTGDSWLVGTRKRHHQMPIVIRSSGLEHQMLGDHRKSGESWRFTLYWRWYVLWTVGRAIKQADHYIALTQNEEEFVKKRFGIPIERTSVMRHLLPRHFEQVPERNTPEVFSILWVALWDKRKGWDVLIEALDRIFDSDYRFTVTLAGVRCSESIVMESIPVRWRDRVAVIPFVPNQDLPDLYASHHTFVFPSRFEGYGKVLVEAMACGCPPISTTIGAAQDLLIDRINGIVLKNGTADELEEALKSAMKNRDFLYALGAQAQKDAKALFHDDVYNQRLELYERLTFSASRD